MPRMCDARYTSRIPGQKSKIRTAAGPPVGWQESNQRHCELWLSFFFVNMHSFPLLIISLSDLTSISLSDLMDLSALRGLKKKASLGVLVLVKLLNTCFGNDARRHGNWKLEFSASQINYSHSTNKESMMCQQQTSLVPSSSRWQGRCWN